MSKRTTIDITSLSEKEWRKFEVAGEGDFACGHKDKELIAAAVEIPDCLYAKDGRKFLIREWTSVVSMDDALIIEPKLLVMVPSK